ncbi:unnamed protein product [Symbiodinium sp. CCMP2456]|nr:unnamed protein product [Symbiodinium sp. CCMP2456]
MAVDVAVDGGDWGDGRLAEELEHAETWSGLLGWLDRGGRLVANLGSLSRGLSLRSHAALRALTAAAEAKSLKVWLTRYANSQEDRCLPTRNKRGINSNCDTGFRLVCRMTYIAVQTLHHAAPVGANPKQFKHEATPISFILTKRVTSRLWFDKAAPPRSTPFTPNQSLRLVGSGKPPAIARSC